VDFLRRGTVTASALVALTAGALHCPVSTWAAGMPPYQLLGTTGQDYYEHSFSLVDLPWQELLEDIPELQGLVPAASQQQLPSILGEVGKRVEDSYQKFTQVVSDEQVTQERCSPGGRLRRVSRREFRYLIVSHVERGQEHIDEYRAKANGKRVQFSTAWGLSSEGFAGMWALLVPGNQSGSRFRYLGWQQVGGHATNVIGFAQRPGRAAWVGVVDVGGRSVVTLDQGVIWIDRATNDILKVWAELLKPGLDVGLELQTTEIRFGEIHVSNAAFGPLLLPLRVTVTTMYYGHVLREVHVYSNYKLPAATTKIEAKPPDPISPHTTN
jgi:hypothetical protein